MKTRIKLQSAQFLDQSIWRKDMKEDVAQYCQRCDLCGIFFIEAIGEACRCATPMTFDAQDTQQEITAGS